MRHPISPLEAAVDAQTIGKPSWKSSHYHVKGLALVSFPSRLWRTSLSPALKFIKLCFPLSLGWPRWLLSHSQLFMSPILHTPLLKLRSWGVASRLKVLGCKAITVICNISRCHKDRDRWNTNGMFDDLRARCAMSFWQGLRLISDGPLWLTLLW